MPTALIISGAKIAPSPTRPDEDALHHPEHARQHLVRHGSAAGASAPATSTTRVPDADDREQDQRQRRLAGRCRSARSAIPQSSEAEREVRGRVAAGRRARTPRPRRAGRRSRPPSSGSPTPACPRSSSSSAATTISTLSEPATNVWIRTASRSASASRSLAIAPKPPKNSRMKLPSTLSLRRGLDLQPDEQGRATTNATAAAAKTVCVVRRRRAGSRRAQGRGRSRTLSTVVRTRFAAVSSSGVFASCGKQRGLHRAHGARHQRDASAQRVDEPVRPAGKEDDRGRGHEAGPDERRG